MGRESKVSILVTARDNASKVVGKITKSFRNLGSFLSGPKGLIGTLTKFFGLWQAARFVRGSVDAFAMQEEAIEGMRASLIATGKDGSASLRMIADEAARLQSITVQGDEAIIAGVETLNNLAGDLSTSELVQSQSALVALADTFFKGDIQSAASLFGKTLGSSLNALSRYGIEVDATATASEKLAQIMNSPILKAGFEVAKAKAKTLTGQLKQASNAWGDLKEAIGRTIVEAITAGDATKSLKERFEAWTQTITANREVIVLWIRAILGAFKFVGVAFKDLVLIAWNVGNAIGNALRFAFDHAIAAVLELLNVAFIRPINLMLDALSKVIVSAATELNHVLPKKWEIDVEDVGIEFRIGELDAAAWLEGAAEAEILLKDSIAETVEGVQDLADGWGAVAEQAGLAYYAEGRAANVLEDRVGSTGVGGGAVDTTGGGGGSGSRLGTGEGLAGDLGGVGKVGTGEGFSTDELLRMQTILEETGFALDYNVSAAQRFGLALYDMTQNAEVQNDVFARMLSQFATDFPAAFETATRAAIEGDKSIAQAFLGAMAASIAAAARLQAQFYAAKALAALGEGLLTKDPSAFAAAAKFAAASAAFGVLAGVAASVGASGGSTTGGGAGGLSASRVLADSTGKAEKPEATLIIEGGDLLDMADPKVEEQLRKALEDIGDRRVTVIRR